MNPIEKTIVSLSLFLLCVGCSDNQKKELPEHIARLDNLTVYQSDETIPFNMSFEAEVIFGESDERPVGNIAGITVDQSGRVFIGDRSQHTVHVFDRDGNYLTGLGREGNGPGEFRGMASGLKVNDDYLFVYDPLQQRINLFSLESPAFSHTINLSPDNWSVIEELEGAFPDSFFAGRDNRLVLNFRKMVTINRISDRLRVIERERLFYQMDEQGQIASGKMLQTEDSDDYMLQLSGDAVAMISMSFKARTLTAMDDNHLYLAQTKNFLIRVHDVDGNYLRAFYYPFKRKKLSREDAVRASEHEMLQDVARDIPLPATWPALNDMIVDDESRIWLSTVVEEENIYEWWVLENSGETIAKFTWPRQKRIEVVRGGHMYTIETDQETGLQQVVRYRIVLG